MNSPPGTTAPAAVLERRLRFGPDDYPFAVCAGPGAWDDLARRLAPMRADRYVMVADAGLPDEPRERILRCLRESAPVTICPVHAGEEHKTPAAVTGVLGAAFGDGATRGTVVVAVGGGQAGNIAGLAAAMMFRGAVRLLHLPTTLLALSDSVVSRKQAVNHGAKNNVGTFKTPAAVWGHLDMLRTLPAEQIRAALCEGAKNLVAIAPERAPQFAAMFRPDARYDDGEILAFIGMCLDAKQAVMLDDPDEKHRALVLEYGHTAGHAAELLTGLTHGLAIGVGGLVAARAAALLGFPGAGLVSEMHQDLLRRIGAPFAVPPGLDDDTWTRTLLRDNKRGYRPIGPGHLEMVLLEEPGIPHTVDGLPLTQVPVSTVLQAIRDTERAA